MKELVLTEAKMLTKQIWSKIVFTVVFAAGIILCKVFLPYLRASLSLASNSGDNRQGFVTFDFSSRCSITFWCGENFLNIKLVEKFARPICQYNIY